MLKQHYDTFEKVHLFAKISDMKEEHYRLTLVVDALMQILIAQGLLNEEQLRQQMQTTELQIEHIISASLHPMA
jgi:hypothetical protein